MVDDQAGPAAGETPPGTGARNRGNVEWRDVRVLYRREMRAALRDRTIVLNSILLPFFMYPVLLWLMFSAITFVQGLAESSKVKIGVLTQAPAAAEVADSLRRLPDVQVVVASSAPWGRSQVQNHSLDALVELLPPTDSAAALPGNFRVLLTYDQAENGGRQARDRVVDLVDRYRTRRLRQEAADLGVGPGALQQYIVAPHNVSTGRQMGARILAEMIPAFLVVVIALGCFFPAVETTAGERERSTWETLMTVSASRLSVVTAKYMYVATLGVTAAVLNVAAISISIGAVMAPLLRARSESMLFRLPLVAVPVMLLGAVALALFFAAAMMILASFARTFKDGQSMVTPVYWLALIPVLMGNSEDMHLSLGTAVVPIVNVTLMIRDALNGIVNWLLVAETFFVLVAVVAACLALARNILRFEDFLLGSYDGSFWRFVRERLMTRKVPGLGHLLGGGEV